MAEDIVQPLPAEPVPQTIVPPVAPPKKKGNGFLLLAFILALAILGGGAYFFYSQQTKPSETVMPPPPSLITQESKPNQGFGSSVPTPTAEPTLTSSDSVADIEKDLSGTTIESGNSSEFTTDLQSL